MHLSLANSHCPLRLRSARINLNRMAFRKTLFVMFAVAAVVPFVRAYSAGGPLEACGDMVPQHGKPQQRGKAPYAINVSSTRIRSGDTVDVSIEGLSAADTIKGFMVQARVGGVPVGAFQIPQNHAHIQTLDCGNSRGSAITHRKIEGAAPRSIAFRWAAPKGLRENVVFYATIALNGGVFWVGEQSTPVQVV